MCIRDSCHQHGIDLPFNADSSYSRDRNLWHISHEGLELEDPAAEPSYDHLLVLGVTPEKAPDQGEYVSLTFTKGHPVAINGQEMKASDIVRELNRLGGKHGIGIADIVENRVVGCLLYTSSQQCGKDKRRWTRRPFHT